MSWITYFKFDALIFKPLNWPVFLLIDPFRAIVCTFEQSSAWRTLRHADDCRFESELRYGGLNARCFDGLGDDLVDGGLLVLGTVRQ